MKAVSSAGMPYWVWKKLTEPPSRPRSPTRVRLTSPERLRTWLFAISPWRPEPSMAELPGMSKSPVSRVAKSACSWVLPMP